MPHPDSLSGIGTSRTLADKLIIAHHEYAIDLVAFHDMDDLIEPTVFFYRSHVRSHHVAHLAAGRLQILCGQASRTHQKFDPTPALPLCPRFRPPDEIALCYDPNQSAACIHDRQAAEFALQHDPDGVGDRSVGGNTHGIRGHDVSGPHGVSSSFEFRAYLSASALPLYDREIFSAEVHMPTLPIKAFAVLALGLVAIAPSFALEDNQCYRSCKARCVARYACEGRHPGPNCFTNFNKCRTSCWRMCRHLTGFLPKAS